MYSSSSSSPFRYAVEMSRIDWFSLGPNEEGSKRGHDGSRGDRDFYLEVLDLVLS